MPETGQPFGDDSKACVSETIGGKRVRYFQFGTDRYGRVIADVLLPVDDPLGKLPDKFINQELAQDGVAWHYVVYSDDVVLTADEVNTRQKVAGLGSGSHRTDASWDWLILSKDKRDHHR